MSKFTFSPQFVKNLRRAKPAFGFAGLGEVVFLRTYSHSKEDGTKESWCDVVLRCMKGAWNMVKEHREHLHLDWDEKEISKMAESMAQDMFDMKFLPPGRGLWAMGKPVTTEKRLFAALNNCAFVSTKNINKELTKPFTFLMDASMLGVGVGFDSRGAGKLKVLGPKLQAEESKDSDDELTSEYAMVGTGVSSTDAKLDFIKTVGDELGKYAAQIPVSVLTGGETEHKTFRITTIPLTDGKDKVPEPQSSQLPTSGSLKKITGNDRIHVRQLLNSPVKLQPKSSYVTEIHVIADTREGWVESLRALLVSYFLNQPKPIFDYSKLRAKGEPLKTFGGVSSGPDPLREMHDDIEAVLNKYINKALDSRGINDIMNMIGRCVVAGGIRRSSELSLGEVNDEAFLNLKNAGACPERQGYCWAANNSVLASPGMDYSKMVDRVASNGEPGFVWMDNAREYGIMSEPKDHKDSRAEGVNPCLTGDMIVSVVDEKTKEYVDKPIKELVGKRFEIKTAMGSFFSTKKGFWSNGIKPVFKISLDNKQFVKATDNHLFYVGQGKWQEVKSLKKGDYLIGKNEKDKIQIIEIEAAGEEEVFDCTIPDAHCFLVHGVTSHNCSEQTLESYELCCLVEVFPYRCKDQTEFTRALSNAYTYAKIVTLGTTHWPESNAVLLRNRRIGVSLTGIAQFIENRGLHLLKTWVLEGYDYFCEL